MMKNKVRKKSWNLLLFVLLWIMKVLPLYFFLSFFIILFFPLFPFFLFCTFFFHLLLSSFFFCFFFVGQLKIEIILKHFGSVAWRKKLFEILRFGRLIHKHNSIIVVGRVKMNIFLYFPYIFHFSHYIYIYIYIYHIFSFSFCAVTFYFDFCLIFNYNFCIHFFSLIFSSHNADFFSLLYYLSS